MQRVKNKMHFTCKKTNAIQTLAIFILITVTRVVHAYVFYMYA